MRNRWMNRFLMVAVPAMFLLAVTALSFTQQAAQGQGAASNNSTAVSENRYMGELSTWRETLAETRWIASANITACGAAV